MKSGLPKRGVVAGAVLAAGLVAAAWASPAWADEPAGRPGVSRGARLFITKAYPLHGALSDEDFRQLADSGFTGVVNRWDQDFNRKPTLPRYIEGAARAGLDAMSWRHALIDAPAESEDQTVTHQGKTTRYTRPYSPAAWAQVTEQVVEQARMSLASPNFKAAFLDFEIYDRNKTNGYAESYDDESFALFFQSQGREAPAVEPAKRRKHLSEQGLLEAYIRFQFDKVAAEVRTLRQAVDAVNPAFQIGVYGWGPMIDAVKQNVATAAAPVVELSAMTYGRTRYSNAFAGGYDADAPDRPALKWALITNAQAAAAAREKPYPAIVLGGHYPQSPGPADGTQYQFTARQAFNSALYADGYWIWTDWQAPKPFASRQAWLDAMMPYWQEANAAVEAEDWTWASRQPAQVADPEATQPMLVLTRDGVGQVTAWDPLTGERLAQDAAPGAGWYTAAEGEVDAIAGSERVRLRNGWIEIEDPESQVLLLRFFVGTDQQQMQLVPPAEAAAQQPR